MFATIKKELLVLLRDPGGLLMLLIMPMALIIVTSIVQDAPYRDYQEMKFDILVANNDKGSVGKKLVDGLAQNKSFNIKNADPEISEASLKKQLKEGKAQMGIIIPKTATASVVNVSNKLGNTMSESMGITGNLKYNDRLDSSVIQLLFDPTVKPASRNALNYALNQYITQTKIEVMLQRMAKMNGGTEELSVDWAAMNVLPIEESSLEEDAPLNPSVNSVQHNVPAWTIFGIFLIVVPISGNLIRERDEGSAVRVQLIPNAAFSVGLGKILFYILVCLLQFFAMILVGLYLMPAFGLPSLKLGPHAIVILPVAICIAFVAVTYSYFIGSVFKTANQAMPFGAITAVLMSAIGGIWVPIELLPPIMKKVALASPLQWSLDAVNQVILREQGFAAAAKPMGILLLIGSAFGILAFLFRRNK